MLEVLAFASGVLVVMAVIGSSVRTVLLPRGVRGRIARMVFVSLRLLFKVRVRRKTPYEVRDRVLAFYGPVSLLCLLGVWIIGVVAGYTAMFWAVGVHPLRAAFTISGSSITTLGFAAPHAMPQTVLAFTEAGVGLVELAMLITFLPNIYSDFHAREREVTKVRVEAGSPPTGANILIRLHRLERLDVRTQIWMRWIDWFATVEDSHTAFPVLSFFRSPVAEHSWVTASGAVLDGAALAAACLDAPRDLEAELCVRSGYLCLRRIAEQLSLPFADDPAVDDPIAVTRDEFDDVWDQMRDAGVPLKPDREQAWHDFAGWRVNYDEPLIRLATLTEAPIAPWSSDRGLVLGRRRTFIERMRT
ncbi:MAG: hypothetical protein ACYDH6_13380 [Acidimicrobiales bacterium]